MENYLKKLCVITLLFSIIPSVSASRSPSLSPPWYLLQAELKATLSSDLCVQVSDIQGEGGKMKINIQVCEYNKAIALAAFLNREEIYSNDYALTIQVVAPGDVPVDAKLPSTLEETAQMLNRALIGNARFVRTHINQKTNSVYAEFKPVVVQYFSDDISDAYRNTNLVAAAAFNEIFGFETLEIATKIYTTTSQMNG